MESGSESPEGDTRLSILLIFGSASDPIVFVLIIFCLSDKISDKSSKISKSSDSILASASTLVNGVKEGNKNKNVSKNANRDGSKLKRGNTIGLRLPMTSPRLCLIYAIALHGY